MERLEQTARRLGADLFGSCDLEKVRGIRTVPEKLLCEFASAVSIGIALDSEAVDSISRGGPSPAYAAEYEKVNRALDETAAALVEALASEGRTALAIPASQTLDRHNELGALSHRAAARAAGLGWIGKSLLFVAPEFGPRVRLATVLTNLEALNRPEILPACGDCRECIDACPAGALSEQPGCPYPPEREPTLDTKACRQQCERFAASERIGAQVCGVCVRVCPAARWT